MHFDVEAQAFSLGKGNMLGGYITYMAHIERRLRRASARDGP